MADSRKNNDSTANDIYETVLSLSGKMRTYYQSKSSACLLTEIKHELQSINQNLKESLTQEEKEVLAILIVTTREIMKSFVYFADALFSVPGFDQNCFWELNKSFWILSTTTPLMQQLLVEEGVLSGIICELELFKNCSSSEDLMHLILVALSTLCNFLQVSANVSYCLNTKCDSIVRYFVTSTHPLIHLFATIILAHLDGKLTTEEHNKYCKLQNNDIKTMMNLLTKPDTSYVSVASLLKALQVLLSVDKDNIVQFLSEGILIALSDILINSDITITNEVLMTVWLLAADPTGLSSIRAHSELIKSLNDLHGYEDHNVALILNCLLWDIAESKDYSTATAFVQNCYLLGMYERCMAVCSELLITLLPTGHDFQMITLIKGKSLFHICNKLISRLPVKMASDNLPARQILDKCIKHAVEAVNLLGSAHDQCFIDEEGSKFLDLCMMFLIQSANALKQCERCLLCLKSAKTKCAESTGDSNINATSRHHRGLHRSHVWPKAVLDAFSSGLVKTASQRLFRICGTDKNLTQLKSPKEMTWFMLCSDCEQMLGVHEENFIRRFFKKIYDTSSSTKPLEGQAIEYGSWLYHFCASMCLRGIALLDLPCNDYLKRFRNAYKLYEIFVNCRKVLLSSSSIKKSFPPPPIHLLINPTSPTCEENEQFTTIHELLVSPAFLGVAASKHSKVYFKSPADSTVFVAHIGIMNVVVDIENIMSSLAHCINPEGGLYLVPPESERNQFIPSDVKEVIYTTAKEMEVQLRSMPKKLSDSHWAKNIVSSPQSSLEKTFMVLPAKKEDSKVYFKQGVTPSQDINKRKIMDFLPNGFKIEKSTGSLILPPGHCLLLHCEQKKPATNTVDSRSNGITLFLAIGDGSKEYPSDNPYVIYHKYGPGMYFNMAVFVSKNDLSVTKLITKNEPHHIPKMLSEDRHFMKSLQLALSTKLHHLGYSSLTSFYTSSEKRRSRQKCITKNRCWYCIDRCDNCMKPAAIDLTEKVNNVILKFCSENCKADFHHNPTVVNMLPEIFTVGIVNEKIAVTLPSGHIMLQDVKDYYDECGEDLAAQQTVSVCVGNGSTEYPKDKIYIIYEYSTIIYKTIAAFFINDDLTLNILPMPNESCDVGVVKSLRESIQKRIAPMVEAIAKEDGFSSFTAWCSVALILHGVDNTANVIAGASKLQHSSNPSSCKTSCDRLTCSYCNHTSDGLKQCSRCHSVQYCGRECQKKHWNTHKSDCHPFK